MADFEQKPPFNADSQVVDDTPNRGNDTRLDEKDRSPTHVTIMSIDETIITYLTDTIKPTITENGVVRLVPVTYGTPEQWAQYRQNKVLRESNTDKIQTPLIMIRRSNINRGMLTNPSNKYIQMSWESGWNRRNGYDRFSVLNGIIPSKQYRAVVVPDYFDIKYDVILWTEYEAQMSDLIGQISVESDEFWGTRNNFKFRVLIDEFTAQSDMDTTSDRVVRSSFTMKVSAYLVPEKIIKNFKWSQNDIKAYTAKKLVTIVEVDETLK